MTTSLNMPASTTDLKALSRRWFEEVWNQGQSESIDALFAAAGVAHGLSDASGRPVLGPPGFRTFYDRFRAAFSDIHIEVDDVIAEADKTCTRFTFTATHTGPELGFAPTGRRVRITGLCLIRWQDGQIAEAWNEFDAAGMNSQLA